MKKIRNSFVSNKKGTLEIEKVWEELLKRALTLYVYDEPKYLQWKIKRDFRVMIPLKYIDGFVRREYESVQEEQIRVFMESLENVNIDL